MKSRSHQVTQLAAAARTPQVLPKQACSGIESTTPGCTDKRGEYLWANAYYESQALGFEYSGGPPDWALWLNAPNRRGVHQVTREQQLIAKPPHWRFRVRFSQTLALTLTPNPNLIRMF